MGSCAHFMNSERFRNLFGPTVDDCYWTDVSGLHASSNFRTIYLGISNNFWCGFWVNGQLLHCFCLLIIRLNVGSLAFFIHFLHLPQNWIFEWWSQINVVHMRLHWTGDEIWMFEIIAIISSRSWLHILVMHVESKLVGTFLVKSSATTAVPELRFSTCQCTCAITHSWRWDGITNDGITNEVLVERLYRTSSCKFCSFVMHSSSLSMALVAVSDIFGWQGIYSL